MNAILTAIAVVCVLSGCQSDEEVLNSLHPGYRSNDRFQQWSMRPYDNVGPYHRRFTSQNYMQFSQANMGISAPLHQQSYPVMQYIPPPSLPHVDETKLHGLQSSMTSMNDRRDDLQRIMHELALEQQNFEQGLSQVRQEYEASRQMIASEYGAYMARIQSMAAMQAAYSQDMVYVNAHSPVPNMNGSPFIQHGYVQPFSAPQIPQQGHYSLQTVVVQVGNGVQASSTATSGQTQAQVIGTAAPVAQIGQPSLAPVSPTDQTTLVTALSRFIDTCHNIATFSPSGGGVTNQLQTLRSDLLAHQT